MPLGPMQRALSFQPSEPRKTRFRGECHRRRARGRTAGSRRVRSTPSNPGEGLGCATAASGWN